MSRPSHAAKDAAVRGVIEPVIASLGLDLEDLDVQAAGRRRRVCVVVDRDGGIDLDGIASTSRAVSDALDACDAMGDDAYVLEVTSPGTDRPLTLPRHWRRNIGRLVKAHLAGEAIVEGRIRSVDDAGVILDVTAGSSAQPQDRQVPWAELVRGDVQVEFRRPEPSEEEA